MPDLFGKKQLGRATNGGRFYATPTERVEAGAVYFPDESSLLFGVAEYTVEAGNLGAFATEGTFVFEKPSDWLDSLGRKVFYRPSTGEIVNQDRKGDVLIGFQVLANVPDNKLGVVLTQGENSVVIMVTSTADSGAGSLRQAIADAQDGDVILFDADVFSVGQTTAILLSSYLAINKSVSIYGGFSDGAGGYTSGATKRFYVYRDVEGVKTKTYISDDNSATEGETVLFENVCRVALDGQEAVRCIYSTTSVVLWAGIGFINGKEANGGGFFLSGTSQSTLTDCNISDCSATSNGGVVFSAGTSQSTLTDCNIDGCSAPNGGAVYSTTTSHNTLNNCIITNCSATSGGGVYSTSTSQNTLNACTITDCSTTNSGGGVYSTSTSQNTLNACTITDCSATNSGGGVYSTSTSQNTLNACTITDCSATSGGGVCSRDTSQNTLNDCVISDCNASTYGGGVFATSACNMSVYDCTITNNTATGSSGGVYVDTTNKVTMTNCATQGNNSNGAAKDINVFTGKYLEAVNCNIEKLRVGSSGNLAIDGITTVDDMILSDTATVTIADGAALTLTGTATIGAATFTSDGRGYLATASGIDISSATLTGVVACSYGAGLESFDISADGATWSANDLTTPILLEQKGDGDVWTTLSDDATGGSYSDTFAIGTTLRAFDGVRFFVASLDAYWQVEPFVVASNGGGGAGDDSPSWTISDATITPNVEEV